MTDDLTTAAAEYAGEESDDFRPWLMLGFKAGARWAFEQAVKAVDDHFGDDYYSRPIRARAAGEGESK